MQRAGGLGLPGAPERASAASRARATSRRIWPRRTRSKKDPPAPPRSRDRLPRRRRVDLWATDEHRIGLKPILHKVWCFDGQRPIAPVQHRYDWRYLVGFVHPASGRTVFHLATSREHPPLRGGTRGVCCRGRSWSRQADRTGAGSGRLACAQRLRVPDHVHLLFLPPYSPELQPAEHLWPLTNTALVNRHFATIDDLEDVQAARCVALQARPDLVRSTTLFQWWPQLPRNDKALGEISISLSSTTATGSPDTISARGMPWRSVALRLLANITLADGADALIFILAPHCQQCHCARTQACHVPVEALHTLQRIEPIVAL